MVSMLLLCSGWLLGQSPCDFNAVQIGTNEYQFTSTYNATCIEFESWDLGDGTTLQEVSNPHHLYLPGGWPVNASFTVTHKVQVAGVTYTCTQVVTAVFPGQDPTNFCNSRYFNYDVNGCSNTFNATIAALIDPNITSVSGTMDWGDNTLPEVETPWMTHTYPGPGSYTATQNYSITTTSGVILEGSCSRPITIGCCCSTDPDINVTFNLDCCQMTMHVDAEVCCNTTKCQSMTIRVGDNPAVVVDPCSETEFCITDYSSYGDAAKNFIHVTYSSFCHGQAFQKTVDIKPSNDGIFLGGDPTAPTTCNPAANIPSDNGSGAPVPGMATNCNYRYSKVTDYDVLTGLGYLVKGPVNVYVAPNSILEVNTNLEFNTDVTIHMGRASGWDILNRPNTPINGYNLQIQNGTQIVAGCCMWRGIYVFGNGSFFSTVSNVPVKRNRIADALYAVRMISVDNHQARMLSRETDYENNFVSIRATDGNSRIVQTTQAFYNNTFTSTGLVCMEPCLESAINVLPPGVNFSQERSYAGILIRGNTQPAFPGNSPMTTFNLNLAPPNDGQQNIFERLAIGIDARDVNFPITDIAQFLDIQGGAYGLAGGVGIRYHDATGNYTFTEQGLVTNGTNSPNAFTFNNCATGIRATSTAPGNPSDLSIRDNRMGGMSIGVDVIATLGDWNGTISNNTISSSAYGIGLFDQTPTQSNLQIIDNPTLNANNGVGILVQGEDLNGATQATIRRNIISSSNRGIVVNSYRSAYVGENVVTLNGGTGIEGINGRYEIECNNVSGTGASGIILNNSQIANDLSFNVLTDIADGLRIDGLCPGPNLIKCNTFINNTIGLHYINGAETGAQQNTGNRWINTGAEADGSVNTANSLYAVPNQPPFLPNPIVPAAGWFIPVGISPPVCTANCQPGLTGGGGGGEGGNGGGHTGGGFGPGNNPDKRIQYQQERLMMGNILEQPDLLENTGLADFFKSNQKTTAGQAAQIRHGIAGLFQLPLTTTTALQINQTAVNTHMATIQTLETQLQENLPENQTQKLLSKIEAENRAIATLVNQNNALLQGLQQGRAQHAQHLLGQLDALNTTTVFEQNEKTVMQTMLESTALGNEPNADQLVQLKAIAEQCPLEGGPAVWLAASSYQSFSGQPVAPATCTMGNADVRNNTSTPAEAQTLSVFPNPAQDQLNIQVNPSALPATIALFDGLGRRVFVTNDVLPLTTIALQQWPNGIYTVVVTDNSGVRTTQNVVVQR